VNAAMAELPAQLPPGERVLWQGSPSWAVLAQGAFHLRKLAVYFAILLIWYGITSFMTDDGVGAAILATVRMSGIALVPLVLVAVFAWLTSRATTYMVTDRRVVLRAGIALPMTINLPFSRIASASVALAADGSGSVVLALLPSEKLAYLALWPHARPWRIARPEPMLRCIPDAARAADIVARALAASAHMPVRARASVADRQEEPSLVAALS
jgi:hypothetical protein